MIAQELARPTFWKQLNVTVRVDVMGFQIKPNAQTQKPVWLKNSQEIIILGVLFFGGIFLLLAVSLVLLPDVCSDKAYEDVYADCPDVPAEPVSQSDAQKTP